MRWFWQEKPRPLAEFPLKTLIGNIATYDQYEMIRQGMDRLLQSHAALEQKLGTLERMVSEGHRHAEAGREYMASAEGLQRLDDRFDAKFRSMGVAISALDARLKGTGDALSVHIDRLSQKLFEESIPELYGEFGTINDTVDALAKELSLARRARRKKAKK